jgi:hypothetical protein
MDRDESTNLTGLYILSISKERKKPYIGYSRNKCSSVRDRISRNIIITFNK